MPPSSTSSAICAASSTSSSACPNTASAPIPIKPSSSSHSASHTQTFSLPPTPPPEAEIEEIAHRAQTTHRSPADAMTADKTHPTASKMKRDDKEKSNNNGNTNTNENENTAAATKAKADMADATDAKHSKETEHKDKAGTASTNRPNLKVATHKTASKGKLGRLPSLKQISERLTTTTTTTTAAVTTTTATSNAPAKEPIAEEALSDVTANTANTANVTSDPPQSQSHTRAPSPGATAPSRRLKLPASAMTRANLSSTFIKPVDGAPVSKDKDNKDAASKDTKDATSTASAKDAKDTVKDAKDDYHFSLLLGPEKAAPTPHVTPAKIPNRARQSVGLGLPGLGLDTPRRDQPAEEPAVPDVVVVKSTPERAAPPPKRLTNENGEHPLAHKWTLFYDSKTYKPETAKEDHHLSSWEASLLTVGTVDTVEGFARHMNNIRLPSSLAKGSNYHLFKDGIRPMWEDPANKNGGKWVMFVRGSELLNSVWAYLAMALVGEMLDGEDKVCGIVVSTRPKIDRIQIWTRTVDDIAYLNNLALRILDTLALDARDKDNISLEFQPNSSSVKASPELMSIPLPNMVNRSASLAFAPGGHQLRRSPSSPGGTFTGGSPIPGHAALPGPLNASPVPMRRSGSAGANAFAGPLGAPRRLVSTTADASA